MIAGKPPLTSKRKLLLVDCDERTRAMLIKSIARLGMEAISAEPGDQHFGTDVIGLIVEIDDFESENLVRDAHQHGLPIIALSRHETLSQIQSAIRIGATAMLNRPFTQSSVYTTLMMANGLRERINSLEADISRKAEQLHLRPQITKAVARLMVECGIDEHEAFGRIRALSMELNISIEAICADVTQSKRCFGVRS